MDGSNQQEDNMENGDNIDGISGIEEYDSDDEDEYDILDKNTLQKLNNNNPAVSALSVDLNRYNNEEPFFNSIDWKENGNCISDNMQLKKLYIYNNGSSSYLGDPGKYTLGEEGHNLPTRQQLQDFFSCVYQNKFITNINIGSIDISNQFGGDLIEGLQGHPGLVKLEIGHAKLGSAGCTAVGKVLKHQHSKLKDLDLRYCQLDGDRLEILCDGLVGNNKLKKLYLSGNKDITSNGWRALSTVLQHTNCKLVTLELHFTGIDDDGENALGSALCCLQSLKVLDLSHNQSISTSWWPTLFNQLSQTSVESLNLSSNGIDNNGLALLANISTLKSLDLGINRLITPVDWESFFNSLQSRGAQLKKLDIRYNKVGGASAAALGSLVSSMSTLKTFVMNGMSHDELMTRQGWQTFFTTLQDSNLNLVKLYLSDNSIYDEGLQLLVRVVSRMSSLKCLSLSSNKRVTPTGWRALTGLLRSPNVALKEVCLNENYIDDDTVVAFASALEHNKTLKELSLDECYDGDDFDDDDDNELITMRGWAAFSTLLCNKSSIMDTYNSNHTLQCLSDGGYHHTDDLTSNLQLNGNEDKAEVARQKILQTHFSTLDNLQEFLDMELDLMPTAIEWIGRDLAIGWEGTQVSGLSTMFNLMRRVPDLFDYNAQKQTDAAKRKR